MRLSICKAMAFLSVPYSKARGKPNKPSIQLDGGNGQKLGPEHLITNRIIGPKTIRPPYHGSLIDPFKGTHSRLGSAVLGAWEPKRWPGL